MSLEAALAANAPKALPTCADGSIALAPVPAASSIPTLPVTVRMLTMPRSLTLRSAGAGEGVGVGVPQTASASASASASGVGSGVGSGCVVSERAGTRVQVVRTSTAFHSVAVGFDCRRLPAHLRPWLVLLQEVLMSTDVEEQDGCITPYTDVVKSRQQQTASMGTSIGWGGSSFSSAIMAQQFFICGTALPSSQGFAQLCEWIGKLLGRTILRPDRIAVCAKNINKDITSSLRDGDAVSTPIYIYIHICIYRYICVYICIHVHVYI